MLFVALLAWGVDAFDNCKSAEQQRLQPLEIGQKVEKKFVHALW